MKEKISKPFTIYKSAPVEAILKTRPDRSASGRISQVCERYRHIINADMPEVTDNELTMLANALFGTFIDPLTVDYLWQEIADERDDSDPEKPIPEYLELAEKIKSMSIAQRYALIENIKM